LSADNSGLIKQLPAPSPSRLSLKEMVESALDQNR
jgi:hypothetical protein